MERLRLQLSGPLSPAMLDERFAALSHRLKERGSSATFALLIDARGLDFGTLRMEHGKVALGWLRTLRPHMQGYEKEAFVHERRSTRLLVAASQKSVGLARHCATFGELASAERWLEIR